ncbi:AGE family epimerase/isomerase [Photobacterium sp. J15]|uniref:AGE family epimerase/isomerase n=1 Tax=Photobacterium sp. J15 TaxID=265901 RepID=UPI0007E42004|nr:AGE family epimerase/isomerase [Photobacterium sp. J15]
MNSLTYPIHRIRTWLKDDALPTWITTIDKETGLFAEGLNQTGTPFPPLTTRFRVQPRQIYVFAHATQLGLIDGRDTIDLAINQGLPHFGSPHTGFQFSLEQGRHGDDRQINLYEQAFALLSYAWHYKLTATKDSADNMEVIYQFITHHLTDKDRGGLYLSQACNSQKCQNPHMHLFEALMVCFEHTGNTLWLERAKAIYLLFGNHFLQQDHLAEFFDAEFRLDPQTGTHVDPGHHYEWIWLLNHYYKLTGTDVSRQIETLLNFARKYGHNTNGLVRDEVLSCGEPLRTTSRLWCQTEYLKACVALWERGPSAQREKVIAEAVEQIFSNYLEPAIKGLWVDQLDASGQPVNPHAPASTFYHIFLAFSEVLRLEQEA